MAGKLSAKFIAAIKDPGRYGDGDGLWLIVSNTGAKRWAFRFRRPDTGKPTEMGLGSADVVTLAEARAKAEEARKARHSDGANPIEQRDHARRTSAGIPNFKKAADDYIASHEIEWRNPKHRDQWRMTIDRYCQPLFTPSP